MTRYRVTAERGATPIWVLQCVEHPGAISETSRLASAERLMIETIAFVADVPPEDIQIDLEPALPEALAADVTEARRLVEDLAESQRQAATASRRAARKLIDAGLTGADTARVLGISAQRVSQLLGGEAA